jgi:hypothetical protein
MRKHHTKAAVLEAITRAQTRLVDCLQGLADEERACDGVKPGWCVNDVLMHLVAWERRMLRRIEALKRGVPGRAELDTNTFNEAVYRRYHGWPTANVKRASKRSFRVVIRCIEQLDETDLADAKIAALIAHNTFNHYRWATSKMRSWQRGKRG